MGDIFRRFNLIDKVKESSAITLFYFKPDDQDPLLLAKPGQYLTLQIPLGYNNEIGDVEIDL